MSKTKKRIIIAVIIVAVIVATAFIIKAVRNASTKVEVTSVASLNNGDMGGEMSTSGMVTDEGDQSVRPTSTQVIKEVYVTEGQSVKKGDKLMAYDMESQQLTLQTRQLAVEKAQQTIKSARAELNTLRHTVPVAPAPSSEDPSSAKQNADKAWNVLIAQSAAGYISGSGTADDPRVYALQKNGGYIFGSFYNALAAEAGDEDLFFRVDAAGTHGRTLNARYLVALDDDMRWDIDGEAATDDIAPDGGYTAEELAARIKEIQQSLPQLDLDLRRAKLELKMQQDEAVDGVVYAKADGVVKTVGNPNSPPQDGSAFLVVSSTGGMTVQGTVSELLLDKVKPGQTITCSSWDTGNTYTAIVRSVDKYPSDSGDYYGGNPNVSQYNFYADLQDGDDLKPGDYLDISVDGSESANVITLSKAYVRSSGSKFYVMKRGDNGRLVKQDVTVGKTYYGELVEILDGITEDDYLAFPYGDGTRTGASTKESEEVMW